MALKRAGNESVWYLATPIALQRQRLVSLRASAANEDVLTRALTSKLLPLT